MAGSYLIEKIFGIDGIGLLTFKAIGTRDYGIIMGFLVIGVLIRLFGNLISDLCTELSKRNSKNNYSKSDIENKLKDQNATVCAITRQIFFRLSKSTSHIE